LHKQYLFLHKKSNIKLLFNFAEILIIYGGIEAKTIKLRIKLRLIRIIKNLRISKNK
jgi:hypothetical protein